MATASQPKVGTNNSHTATELASQLWATANALRGNIDAAEYKHVVLPLMFLKYISDAFEELHEELESKVDEGRDPEQPDEYKERNVFWVPQEARWSIIQSRARQEDIGATIDRAMDVIERDNDPLKGVLPKNLVLQPQIVLGRMELLLGVVEVKWWQLSGTKYWKWPGGPKALRKFMGALKGTTVGTVPAPGMGRCWTTPFWVPQGPPGLRPST